MKMLISITTLSLLLSCSNRGHANETEPLVGVSYFAGWWEELPNKWHDRDGKDWRLEYPERVPLLGEYNTQKTMDSEIIAAAGHGVDFFAILWYYQPDGVEREPNARYLERGITNFINSPEAHRMKFMIEFCNHPPYDVKSDADWEACIEKWLRWMQHPSYLRVDGRPVFKVHGFHHFMVQLNMNAEKAAARLSRLREAVGDAGLGELILGCGVMAHEAIPQGHPAVGLFDFTGTYMDLPQLEQKPEDYPYTELTVFSKKAREIHVSDAIPWMPYLPSGWSPRPWPDKRAYFSLPDKEEWHKALDSMRKSLNEIPSLGLPGQPAFTIYAWNEFGEGGFVAPTHGDGYMKLDAIADVFGK
jgi:hypothetical protein